MTGNQEILKLALWVAIAGLVGAVIPIWPYGYYTLLRLIVTAVGVYALTQYGTHDARITIGLAAVVLLFNPLIPVHLTRAIWLPINLGVAFWFWKLAEGTPEGDQ